MLARKRRASKLGPFDVERYVKFDTIGKKAYFTSTFNPEESRRVSPKSLFGGVNRTKMEVSP